MYDLTTLHYLAITIHIFGSSDPITFDKCLYHTDNLMSLMSGIFLSFTA